MKRTIGTQGSVQCDTGLSEFEQRQREQIVRFWAWRVTWLQKISGADIVTTIRAVEDADRTHEENAS